MAGDNWTFWLNMTNFALGAITLLALLLVFSAVGWELLVQWVRKPHATDGREVSPRAIGSFDSEVRAMLQAQSHSLSVPELGLTMADGGERVEPSEPESSDKKPRK